MPRPATRPTHGGHERRAVARIEATRLGLDIRFVVTSLNIGSAEWIYNSLYCARGQAEKLIKLHKTQLASDRTSCRSALANQVRLVIHTTAYWLMLTVRDVVPRTRELLPLSLRRCGFDSQKLPRVSSRPQAAFDWPSPQPVQTRIPSAACPVP
jgi:Transposase DDE domain group 1